jgi:hypothetical protein
MTEDNAEARSCMSAIPRSVRGRWQRVPYDSRRRRGAHDTVTSGIGEIPKCGFPYDEIPDLGILCSEIPRLGFPPCEIPHFGISRHAVWQRGSARAMRLRGANVTPPLAATLFSRGCQPGGSHCCQWHPSGSGSLEYQISAFCAVKYRCSAFRAPKTRTWAFRG